MKRLLFFIILLSCGGRQLPVTLSQIDGEQQAGNYSQATYLIDIYKAQNPTLSADSVYQLEWRKEKMRRIILDFPYTQKDVIEYVKKYYPNVNDDSLLRWETTKALEYKVIDGKKMYFDRARQNLFRIDKNAIARKLEVDGAGKDVLADTLQSLLPRIVAGVKQRGNNQAITMSYKIKYTVTLKPNTVPDGEVVSCWLPFPRDDNRRQSEVKLLSVNDANYTISPDIFSHKTVFIQKTARKDEPLIFEEEFSYRAVGEWFDINSATIKPYDTSTVEYKAYTCEKPPHIVFTDSIKAISERIVGKETDPRIKARKLFEYIDAAYPWAGAREYATIDNIPLYVAENFHGDCGQVTLLFLTLARYNGIPARWQSGYMLHPGRVNLHDWGEYYLEGIGWVPVDESFGVKSSFTDNNDCKYFFASGMDPYRMVVNNDYSGDLYPNKIYPRSDDVDFQRGELEWRGGNIYYDKFDWNIDVQECKQVAN
ncbi:MAG: transglutaminase domain-containing protein [Tannerella sp.]|jgi:transglutaminase-like putative cysteine protease|nr:transglutaminase domain-containing protein [Tannerella sp.]